MIAADPQKEVLFASDMHLPAGPSKYRDALHALLEGPARQAQALFLLGDVFEYWLGDDVSGQDHGETLRALALCAKTGTRLYFMPGNRDFLVSDRLLSRYGITLLPDPVIVALPDGPALLSHGDQWCTQDEAYQRWRRFAHWRPAQAGFRALPRRLRRQLAQRLRARSQALGRMTADDLLDVNPAAAERAFATFGVRRIIHGHTHRPDIHAMRGGTRIVLPDWRPGDYRYLRADCRGLTIHRIR
ncbi:UDP-2,3-diacylglucosamine diphosphatase [Algiphilus sp.]|uniref:UDP-2,3-diacylglucosamine diphosphatase n=1 Tax=Algiphilus sp. TaxID=1872431 RepID=UPI003BABF648